MQNPNNINNFLIFSLFEGEKRWIGILIMMLLPYIAVYINKYWSKFIIWWYPKQTTIVLRHQSNFKATSSSNKDVPVSGASPNFSYKAVCWYILKDGIQQQKFISSDRHSVKQNEYVGSYRKRIPVYDPNDPVQLTYKGYLLNISFVNHERTIYLRCANIAITESFINDTIVAYMNYCYNSLDENKLYVCEWKHGKNYCSEGAFQEKEMIVHKNFSNVYLKPEIEQAIRFDIEQFLNQEEFYAQQGIPFKRGYLFYGPPGTGKSSTVYAIAREYNMNLYKISIGEMKSASREDAETFKKKVQKIPPKSIVVIEEVEIQIYNDREEKKDKTEETTEKSDEEQHYESLRKERKQMNRLPMSSLMEVLDGYDTFHQCIIILTTNHRNLLYKALIRPGRIDKYFLFDELDKPNIENVIHKFCKLENVKVPDGLMMTSAELINKILLPNKSDSNAIERLLQNAFAQQQQNKIEEETKITKKNKIEEETKKNKIEEKKKIVEIKDSFMFPFRSIVAHSITENFI